MEHLNALEAAFWSFEDEHASLHIASVAVFEGPAPAPAEIRRLYRHKLHLVPRMRQRLHDVPLALGRPAWEDDPTFRLADHISTATVQPPGGTAELTDVFEQLMSTHMDRSRPLWQVWLIDGLRGGQWAIATKMHHSMVDGVAGMMVLSRFFDAEPTAVMPRSDHWVPHAPAGRVATARAAVRDDLRAAVAGVRAAGSLGRHPVGSAQWLLGVGRGMLGYAGSLRPARSRQLSGSLGSLRRYRVARADLDAVRRVKTALGGSVNDVVLAIVTTGLRDLLLERGERPAPGAVRCLVPVSVRMPSEAEHVDNRVSALLADLPVEFDDPLTRYGAMVARTRDLKASHEAEAGSVLTAVAGYVPPALMDSVLRAYVRLPQRIVTTVITNVPGPHEVRYVLGRRMVALYPYVPIADRLRVGIAVTSYDGQLFFGITADRASVADIDVLQTGLERGLDELVRSARAESESFDRTPVEGTP